MTRAVPDRSSYSAYVDARWSSLYRFAHLIVTDPDEAQDVLQATLVKVYVKWEQVSAAASVDAYVRRMLLKELLGERRLRARRQTRQHLLAAVDEVTDDDPSERLAL